MLNKKLTSNIVIVLTCLFLIAFTNIRFFSNLLDLYPLTFSNTGFLLSVILLFSCLNILILSLFCFKHTTKPVLITILIISSMTAYFMDSYNIIVDDSMIDNVISTDINEAGGLFNFKLLIYLVLLGILPSLLVYKSHIIHRPLIPELLQRAKLISITLVTILLTVWVFGGHYASFFREHRSLKMYSNPGAYIYSAYKFASRKMTHEDTIVKPIGTDAKTPGQDHHRELVVFVVGETARYDRFSLNGYNKETNPLLKTKNVISFSNFWSCGTSTAVSVPCMFSIDTADNFDIDTYNKSENVLDVLKHAGVNIIWLDNNSNSKHIADRVVYQNYKSPAINPLCNPECRDEGLLLNLQQYIDEHKQGDILIVLHQKGNHGPDYYKRYPDKFRKFQPECQTNQLENCSREEIDNAYDNAILYTDFFLAKTIELLEKYDNQFETAMFYVSDHGESLGEDGLYLHGYPNLIAPDTQRHVPAVMWFGKNFDEDDINFDKLRSNRVMKFSHDNIFHTLLGFMEIQSNVYKPEMDILHISK